MKIGGLITLDFTTNNPNTGVVQDADSLPTCEVFEGEIDASILTPLVTKRVGKLGNYKVLIDTSNVAFGVNKSYNVIVEATVAGVTTKSRIGVFILELDMIEEISKLQQPVMF
jgi:hypothetical protein